MLKLYSNDFFANKDNIKTNFEEEYKKIFSTIEKKTKCKRMIKTCEKYLPILADCSKINDFPKDFYSLLITPPEKIAEVYLYSTTHPFFKKLIETKFMTTSKSKKEKYVLDYEYREYSKAIADFFINNEEQGIIKISTCFYCNMAYIKSFDITLGKVKKTKRRIYELDHFIPKSECSLFALSLYNFVPSCKACNHLKLADVDDFSKLPSVSLGKLFPSSKNYDYDNSLKFRIHETNQTKFPPFSFIRDGFGNDIRKNFYIHFERKNSDSDLYEHNEADLFHILDRYEPHKNEFLNCMEKHLKYPASFFMLLLKSLSPELVLTLKNDIFNSEFRNSERQIFQKIYNDLDEQF